MSELKPCPFCGGKAKAFKNAVSCTENCLAIGPNLSDGEGGDHTEAAIAAWNTRTPDTSAMRNVPYEDGSPSREWESDTSAKVDVDWVLKKFIERADSEYCKGIHMATYDNDTKGWEARAKAGSYGEAEHKAHAKLNKHMGAHYTIYNVVNEVRTELSHATPRSEAVELVRQQTDDDCVPCSLAMLFRVSREEVLQRVGNLYQVGKGLAHTWRALESLGLSRDAFEGFATAKDATSYEMHVTLHLAWKRKALISVPSLNIKGGAHMVYVENNIIYDPSPNERYENFEDLAPYEVIIFDESAITKAEQWLKKVGNV